MLNIQEYEAQLKSYSSQINAKKIEINNAKEALIVAQTQLQTYEKQAKELEQECLNLTGRPIEELEQILSDSLNQLQGLMVTITSASNGEMTPEELAGLYTN